MTRRIDIGADLRSANRAHAESVRSQLKRYHILSVNLIGSPGCGKTTTLEATIPALAGLRCAVIEGDIATRRDADRITALGVPCVQINTRGTCHLLAKQVEEVLGNMDLAALDVLFIENVGNLVCPSTTDLGEDFKVALLSVPEGDDKVAKYPRLFREAGCVLLNKMDLIDAVAFDASRVQTDLADIRSDLVTFKISALTGDGMDAWLDWLREHVQPKRSPRAD